MLAATSQADDLLVSIPGLRNHRVRDLPDGVVTGDFNYVINLLLHRMAKKLPRATAIAINTFPGLDPPEVDTALAAVFATRLPIGPFHLLDTTKTNAATEPDPHGCLSWLGRHADGTVAYVSFGTVASPQREELHELALGLEQSGVPFLWSLKEETLQLLSPGFLDRNKHKGLVVEWAPQVEVLKHNAVGAFVTHAGWNSVLESITNAVPMACRPFFGDHRANARSVSHVWKVGSVFEGGVMTKDGVVKALDVLLKEEEEGKKMRARAKELKHKAEKAFEPNGSCMQNFDELVKIVCGV